MDESKIIGVEQETKFYTIGGYRFKMIPLSDLTIPEADRVMKAIGSIRDFGDKTLVEALVAVYGKILTPVLSIEKPSLVMRIAMKLHVLTPLKILMSRAKGREVGEIVQDFFVVNFGSTQPSVASSLNTILNFPQGASRPSMTSSTP